MKDGTLGRMFGAYGISCKRKAQVTESLIARYQYLTNSRVQQGWYHTRLGIEYPGQNVAVDSKWRYGLYPKSTTVQRSDDVWRTSNHLSQGSKYRRSASASCNLGGVKLDCTAKKSYRGVVIGK